MRSMSNAYAFQKQILEYLENLVIVCFHVMGKYLENLVIVCFHVMGNNSMLYGFWDIYK